MLFIMILIEKNKSTKFNSQKIEESIVFMLFNKFLNYFNFAEKDVMWWLIRMNDFISKGIKKINLNQERIHFVYRDYEQAKIGKNDLSEINSLRKK